MADRARAGVLWIGLVGLALASPAKAASPEPAPAPAAAPAPAHEGGVEFRWDAPAQGCPSEAEVLAELERLLGKPLAQLDQARLSAIARVRLEAEGGWDLRLWTVSATDTRQRSMVGEDCEVLADAAALLAAMAIDPNVLARMQTSDAALVQAEQAEDVEQPEPEPQPQPEPESEPEPEPEPELFAVPPPIAAPKHRFRPTLGLRAQGGVSLGDLPDVGPILRLALALQWWPKPDERPHGPGVRIEVEGHYAFVRKARLAESPGQGADLQHAFAVIRGCPVLRHRPSKLEFPICAGIEVGALIGEGVGFPTVAKGSIPWVALDLAPGVVWAPIPNFALGLTAEPWIALSRPAFRVEGFGAIWRPGLIGFRALGGFEVRF